MKHTDKQENHQLTSLSILLYHSIVVNT